MKRPISVAIIGVVFMAAGAVGLVYHLSDFRSQPFPYDLVWISLIRVVAIVSGAYLIQGRNWARWLAVAWLASHVILSAFHSMFELTFHALLFAVVTFFLFRPRVTQFLHLSE